MAHEASPGQLIGGKYRLVSSLGSGGFGRVWKAHDEDLGVDVAIKEIWLPPAQFEGEHTERLKRAAREARNAAKLRDHPNIVTVYEVVIDADRPWIAMQLVDGCSMDEYIKQHGPLPHDLALKVARALLEALDAAHRAGIVHRDVKPANVMMASDGGILLTDFGIARHEADTVITATGTIIGSPEYMAPERIRGQADLPAGDLFSVGATLFQAVEGTSPFRRETSMASMSAVLMDQPPPLSAAQEPMAGLLSQLLNKNHLDRPTVADAAAVLDGPPATAPPGTDDRPSVESSGGAKRSIDTDVVVQCISTVVFGVILICAGWFFGPTVSDSFACGWMEDATHERYTTRQASSQKIVNQTKDAKNLWLLDSDLKGDLQKYLNVLEESQADRINDAASGVDTEYLAAQKVLATCKAKVG